MLAWLIIMGTPCERRLSDQSLTTLWILDWSVSAVWITDLLNSSQSQSHIATDGHSVTKSSWPDICYCLIITVLFFWGVLSDERTGLSFVYAAGSFQPSLYLVRVPWDSWPYFPVSDLRLPFSLPPTTRRVTVEVFDPASTRVIKPSQRPHRK
jgi:hypothetical protein